MFCLFLREVLTVVVVPDLLGAAICRVCPKIGLRERGRLPEPLELYSFFVCRARCNPSALAHVLDNLYKQRHRI